VLFGFFEKEMGEITLDKHLADEYNSNASGGGFNLYRGKRLVIANNK
jgi:hypothetical protein